MLAAKPGYSKNVSGGGEGPARSKRSVNLSEAEAPHGRDIGIFGKRSLTAFAVLLVTSGLFLLFAMVAGWIVPSLILSFAAFAATLGGMGIGLMKLGRQIDANRSNRNEPPG